jgi:hypothetical protein
MASQPPLFLRITAHNTPHHTDPANANEFYAALGMLTVAWGRLEGHVIGDLLTIMNFPEVAPSGPLPLVWERRLDLWTKGFSLVPALLPHKDRAVLFMKSIIDEVVDRNFVSHAVWDEFVPGATEPTIDARAIRPRKRTPDVIEIGDQRVTLTMLKSALVVANRLNLEMTEFTRLLNFLRPPPSATSRL